MKKKYIHFKPFIWMAIFLLGMTSMSSAQNMAVYPIDTVPVIDGQIDTLWDDAEYFKLSTNVKGNPVEEDVAAWSKVMWDDSSLYVLVVVRDDSLVTIEEANNTWKDDCVELFLDVQNDKAPWYIGATESEPWKIDKENDTIHYQYRFLPDTNLVDGKGNGYTPEFAISQNDTGYVLEAHINLWTHKAPKVESGVHIGFDVTIHDRDSVEAAANEIISWHMKEDVGWKHPSAFGTIVLLPMDENYMTVKKGLAPEIDGVVDGNWALIETVELMNYFQGEDPAEDLSATMKAFWEEDMFYLLVDVTDDSIAVRDVVNQGDTWRDDNVEVFIDVVNAQTESYITDSIVQFQFRFLPVKFDGVVDGKNGKDYPDAVKFASQVNETGYVMELAFDMSMLNVSNGLSEKTMGFEIKVADNDGALDAQNNAKRENQVAWNATEDVAWQNPSVYGVMDLLGETTSGFLVVDQEDATPNIDGITDAVWQQLDSISLANIFDVRPGFPAAQSDDDISASFKSFWNESSLYLFVTVMDDSIFDGGASNWQTYAYDNIEVFIDAVNNKAQEYTDTLHYQYRFLPMRDTIGGWGKNELEDVEFAFNQTEDGYTFEARFDLLKHNTPVIEKGQTIGFDVKVSDNDGVQEDGSEKREVQIAWYSTEDIAWQTPAAFGVVKLTSDADVQEPSTPANLSNTVDGNAATLNWDASTDNVGVVGYQIIMDGVVIDTVTETTYIRDDLPWESTVPFGVTAFDDAGNVSEAAITDVVIGIQVSIDEFNVISAKIYPLPAKRVLNIESDEPIQRIEIFNYTGKHIISVKSTSQIKINTIDVSDLSSGVYIIKLFGKDQKIGFSKFIKE
jgi:hypothetical protein